MTRPGDKDHAGKAEYQLGGRLATRPSGGPWKGIEKLANSHVCWGKDIDHLCSLWAKRPNKVIRIEMVHGSFCASRNRKGPTPYNPSGPSLANTISMLTISIANALTRSKLQACI